jgi:uncharacterized surface protein with fasciclin (FAS1) repeats
VQLVSLVASSAKSKENLFKVSSAEVVRHELVKYFPTKEINMKRPIKFAAVAAAAALTVSGSLTVTAQAKVKKPVTKSTKGDAMVKADIVDTAIAAGSFKTLAAALGAAGLVDTLKGAGPFTVLAPTDAAFSVLPAGLVDKLLKPENKAALTKVLTYHVIAGKVKAADVIKLTSAKSLEGAEIAIKVAGGKVTVDGATVTKTDIIASNGLIHVIDKVLVPKDLELTTLK